MPNFFYAILITDVKMAVEMAAWTWNLSPSPSAMWPVGPSLATDCVVVVGQNLLLIDLSLINQLYVHSRA